MLTVFDRPDSAKELYFNLNNSLHLSKPLFSPTYKISGLYAIFTKGICYYVGQSKNLPRRISTHLTGRYESCDEVRIYYVCPHNFEDFYIRTPNSQKLILENNENKLINLLKPTENILVDRDIDLDDNLMFERFHSENNCVQSDVDILLSGYSVTVTDNYYEVFDEIDARVHEAYKEFIIATGRGK